MDPSGSQRPHLPDARPLQDRGARLQRRARRADIVYQNHGESFGRPPSPEPAAAQAERALDVGAAAIGREFNLRQRVPAPHEHIGDRQTKVPRQFHGLIESTLALAPMVERDGHRAVCAFKNSPGAIQHQGGKPVGQRSSFVVLESVNDVSERSFILASGTGYADGARRLKNGPGKVRNDLPAISAHAAIHECFQRRTTRRAAGSEEHARDSIDQRRYYRD